MLTSWRRSLCLCVAGIALAFVTCNHAIGVRACTSGAMASDDTPILGTVATVKLADDERATDLNQRLHFCVFENGVSDYIYVGTKYGMWSNGEFDRTINGKRLFTGKIKHLVYNGVVLQMGDVLAESLKSNIDVHITRVTGTFK